jgi:hypothetical protein
MEFRREQIAAWVEYDAAALKDRKGCCRAFVERIFYFNIDGEIVVRQYDSKLPLLCRRAKRRHPSWTRAPCRACLPVSLQRGVVERPFAVVFGVLGR